MPKQKERTLNDILKEVVTDVPKALGKRKSRYLPQATSDDKNFSGLIEQLETLKQEADKPRRRQKTKNILERSKKEIMESAVRQLCYAFSRTTGYDARWINDAIEEYWQVGKKKQKHNYDKKIRCCQLIHFLKSQGISELQAIALTDQIYDFNKTDAKDTYYYFKRDLKKYYFPEIEIKPHIQIRIFLDALKYGRIVFLRINLVRDKTSNKFQEIIGKIQFAQQEKLDKQGLSIHPVIHEYLNREYKTPEDFIFEISKNKITKDKFAYYTQQFLNDLEYIIQK